MQFIHEMVGAFPKQSCTNIIDFFEKNIDLGKPGTAGSCELDNLEITLRIDFTNPNPNGFGLENTLKNVITEYKNKFPLIDTNISKWGVYPSCQLMKYKPNQHYHHIHCENDGSEFPIDSNKRIFAWMIYLNDVNKGGKTEFKYQKKALKPVAGTLVLWPAGYTHVHRAAPDLKENKYIATGWYNFS